MFERWCYIWVFVTIKRGAIMLGSSYFTARKSTIVYLPEKIKISFPWFIMGLSSCNLGRIGLALSSLHWAQIILICCQCLRCSNDNVGQLQQLLLAPARSTRLHMIEVSLRIKPILGKSEADFTELQIRSVPGVTDGKFVFSSGEYVLSLSCSLKYANALSNVLLVNRTETEFMWGSEFSPCQH